MQTYTHTLRNACIDAHTWKKSRIKRKASITTGMNGEIECVQETITKSTNINI